MCASRLACPPGRSPPRALPKLTRFARANLLLPLVKQLDSASLAPSQIDGSVRSHHRSAERLCTGPIKAVPSLHPTLEHTPRGLAKALAR